MRWHELASKTGAIAQHDPNESRMTDIVLRDKTVARQSRLKDFGYCILKAFAVVVFLSFLRDCGPILPAWLLPLAFLVYALIATFGSMYDVVTTKLHKQDLYNDTGKLSHYNRRWFVWFGGIFVVYLISAALYMLQSPSWDRNEWLLIWLSPFVFYLIFLIMQRIFKKEYAAKYYKARAIRWSGIISALILTALYTLVVSQPPTDIQINLQEIIQDRYLPFENSPAALFAELDKLTTYANCLTEYGLSKIVGASYAVALIVNMIIGLSVFLGVMGLFSACLLSPQEIMSEFKLLPVEDSVDETVQPRYIVLLAVLWIALSGVFVWANLMAEDMRTSDECTFADHWVNDTSRWIILAAEENLDELVDDHEAEEAARAFEESFEIKKNDYINDALPEVQGSINSYYDACLTKADSYVGWFERFFTGAARLVPILGENMMRNEFEKQVIDPVGKTDVDQKYSSYLQGLKELYDEYLSAEEITLHYKQAQLQSAEGVIAKNNISADPVLWPSWDSEDGKRFIQEVLLGKASSDDDQSISEHIADYINQQRQRELERVGNLARFFFAKTT